MYGIDYTYVIFVLPALLLSLWASGLVQSRFSAYDKVPTQKGISGAQAAALLLKSNGITDVKIVRIRGKLTDNYNPVSKTLNLSDSVFCGTSVAAVGVAAHETGHAIQHHTGYFPLAFRRMLVPAANLGSRFGPLLAVLGIAFGYSAGNEESAAIFQFITNAGLLLFGASVLFYIVTLPVEFNASSRALKILQSGGIFTDKKETAAAKKVLAAAALTYVASALTAVGSFVRLLVLTGRRQRKN
ncbi:MAG: zinc metallopeptidase [Bacteroides sp.]|nr:zinc metallopeptidase [Prevotella sp.]MCM1408856.1 zinc metallopeptidase [Treponema brennaborense]MCM1470784.1 zinc metallopeptidase [Bacteroides sp.]